MVEGDGLENRYLLTGDRGFESRPLRQVIAEFTAIIRVFFEDLNQS